jgi:hypothetical protein
VSHVDFAAIFHAKTSIFHDAVFVADRMSDADGLQAAFGDADRFYGPIRYVCADDSVAVACIDHNLRAWDIEFFFGAQSNSGKVVVFDVSDFTDGDCIDAYQYALGRTGLQHENFRVERIIDGACCMVRDVDFSGTGQDRRLGLRGSFGEKCKCG